MGHFVADHLALVAARRGRLIQALFEGDPVAWTILCVVVGAMIVWPIIRAKMS